ncbi:MAG: hypothetical protein RLZZ522_1153 [Verrucomicrobiota bacterium]|jgi:hypothetical protein
MKLTKSLSMALLALASVFRLGCREECHNIASTVGTHENGKVTYYAQSSAITQRYLLVMKSGADNQMVVGNSTSRPLGVVLDEPGVDEGAAVAILGAIVGTVRMVANTAFPAGSMLYTAGSGKVSPSWGATLFLVGRSLTASVGDNDIVEVASCFPMINAAATL